MIASAHHQNSVGTASVVPSASSSQFQYSKVLAYWKQAKPSILSHYVMGGFGFPGWAERFRFRREQDTCGRAFTILPSECSVLDQGSGVGFWTEYFAHRFAHVVSVEASLVLHPSLSDRCSRYPNVSTINGDALTFDPQEEYQVVNRSVENHYRIFADADFNVVSVTLNAAYICCQMGCELVDKWKSLVPQRFCCLPVIGRMAYCASRLRYPWDTRVIPRLVAMIGGEFSCLTNHFFELRARCSDEICRSTT